jgi:hypothetical protein
MVDFVRLLIHALATPLRTQAQLEAEIAMLRHQLNVLRRQTPRPRLTAADRLLFVWLCRLLSVAEERRHDRSAGYRAALAPLGLPALLAMEVAFTWWAAQGPVRGAQPDPTDECGEPALGSATDSR